MVQDNPPVFITDFFKKRTEEEAQGMAKNKSKKKSVRGEASVYFYAGTFVSQTSAISSHRTTQNVL